MIDIRQSLQYADYLSQIGWTVERINGVNYFIKKLPLIGSILKIQRPKKIRSKDIKILSEKYRTFQIILEPVTMINDQWLMINGFKPSKSPYLPTKTLHLDLTLAEQKLFNNLKKDAKLAIHKNLRFGIYNLETDREIKEFRNLWKKAAGWKRYVPPLTHLLALKKSFGKNSLFLMTGLAKAGAIFLIADKTGYYWQAFTGQEGRKLQVQYKIVWEGILWAQKHDCQIFDFEGIYDERFPDKSWLGFSHFKKSFGGHEVIHPGTFVKTMLPFRL